MTPVEISEKIRDHLIAQNAQARSKLGACRYRGMDGTSCALGCLIKDEFYDAYEMEGGSITRNSVKIGLIQSGISFTTGDLTYEMLSQWQMYHDGDYGRWLSHPDEFPSPESTHERLMEAFGV